jgi:GT2 family glycosyltransferase
MKPQWEKGLSGRIYAWGRDALPLSWRRAIRRRFAPERLLGIRKPSVDVQRYDFDPNEARPGRPDVLVLPVIAWSYRRQRPQQLAEALGRRGRRVFYGAVRGPGEPDEPTAVAPGVTLLPIAGVRKEDPADRKLEGKALEEAFASLSRALVDFQLHEAALLLQSPFWTPLALRLRERFGWKVVYDCLDLHAGFATNRPEALEEEERLVREADLVLATSRVLLEHVSPRSRAAHLLPNACDFELFTAAEASPRAGEALTVGYVGAVDDWFDAALFNELACLRPSWRFEIVGGAEGAGASRPESLPNVVFHGERPHRELPALRSRFDVEIIPFRLTELTNAVDPVKLYEAAAAGRPVVATPMRSLLPLTEAGVVTLASTAEEFARAIEAAASESPQARQRRRAFASENTWERRAAQLEQWLRGLYPLVSVVVVTWNGLAWSRMCLESLDRRTDWPRCEILFVDNGSTDGTREWLREEAARRPPEEFRMLAFPENRGFAPAVNAALAASRGESLCLLNNDTIVTRGWLSALVRHLERDPSLGMVGPSTNEIANAAKVETGYRELLDLESWARAFTRGNAGRAEPMDMLAMFCVLLRRKTWNAVGPLDERFTVGMFEDDDYSRRLRDQGLRLAVARDSFVHHWGRGSFRAMPEQEYLRIHRENRARYEEKWSSPPTAANDAACFDDLARLANERAAVFVFPPSIGWDITLVQRPHHFARALARRGFPVVFEIEEGASAPPGLTRVEPGLFLHRVAGSSALPPLPGRILWAFAYNVPEQERLAGARLVYDVIDHPDVFPYPKTLLRKNHERALREAAAVFAVSRPLLEAARASRPDAVYLPNGVEAERFAAPPDPAAVPDRLARMSAAGRPVAGYVGALARWVDAELLEDLARQRPDWDFCLVGEALDESFAALEKLALANLFFLGARPYASIPSILSAFDVGLIPFRLGPEGSNASPIKLYEYLAAGLPVISTPIPECEAVPEVSVGRNARAFSDLLDRAAGSRRSPEFRARALARARENDWSRRVETALAALGMD